MARRADWNSAGEDADQKRGARRRRERRGRRAEWLAVLLLVLKGYWILGRRYRVAVGEIDIIAVRGRRLAFVEVKRRRTIAEARMSISRRQAERMSRTADHWLSRHKSYRNHRIGLDAYLFAPGAWPRHMIDACQRLA